MPPDTTEFLWGTSQSGHSIEGENFDSDWWRWEQRPGRIEGGATSREGAGFLKRFERDLELARDLGHNAFLFSLEWSRIQPTPGDFNDSALEFYRGVFESLQENALEPVCVLQHVTLPRWFSAVGGWRREQAISDFRAYAERMVGEFGAMCRRWIPIREPMHWITMACLQGRWPGPPRRLMDAAACLEHMIGAHVAAYNLIHEARGDALVGASVHARRFFPADANSPWDHRVQRRESHRCNQRYLLDVKGAFDFVGVAYYGREYVRFSPLRPASLFTRLTDSNGQAIDGPSFEPDPDGLEDALAKFSAFGKPLLITANGLATDDDTARCAYLIDHARVVQRVRRAGTPLLGYLHRSLLDGFEWDAGYARRFGLVHVDRDTQSRTPNPSAFLFRELCRTGTISPGTLAQFCPDRVEAESPKGRKRSRRKKRRKSRKA